VLRPLAESDYAAIHAAREDPETAQWVNGLPQPDGATLIRFVEGRRRAGKLLHLVVADSETGDYVGEVLLFVRTPEAAEVGTGRDGLRHRSCGAGTRHREHCAQALLRVGVLPP
jgi:hypothetical protein